MSEEWCEIFANCLIAFGFSYLVLSGLYRTVMESAERSRKRIMRLDDRESTGGVWYE